jgi:hypothetical protein
MPRGGPAYRIVASAVLLLDYTADRRFGNQRRIWNRKKRKKRK